GRYLRALSKGALRPKFHYELVCGARGHELVGTDAAEVRVIDADFVRDGGDLRWYRCLRCDSWLPLQPTRRPRRQYPPEHTEIALPPRGKALRDKIVLRLIALNRAVHFVVLGLLSTLIFVFRRASSAAAPARRPTRGRPSTVHRRAMLTTRTVSCTISSGWSRCTARRSR